ncbi:MAG: DUF4931 domain-containing protein [Candidatus Falkowbacteria bacterium]
MILKKQASEIRKDYFLPKYVIITPRRAIRPRDIDDDQITHTNRPCGLCPDGIEPNLILDHVGSRQKWDAMILKNKYSALSLTNPKAYGTQEVIVETPNHCLEMHQFSLSKFEQILSVYCKRMIVASQNPKIDFILVFKNSGAPAGASLQHSHSQLFASELLSPKVLAELTAVQNYRAEHHKCPYCAILEQEQKSKRKVYEDKHILAFTPYASEYHYELWFYTKRHANGLADLNQAEKKSLAYALKRALVKLHILNLPYNFHTHHVASHHEQHFCLKLQPRDSVWAGVEIDSGIIINSVPPEQAATFYRK